MADQNDSGASATTSVPSNPAPVGGAEETIKKLSEEKRVLEEKNKKLGIMLNLCAKNAENADNNSGKDASLAPDSADLSELKDMIISIKKYVSDSQKKLEKSIADETSDQWKSVMAEMKARFSSVEEKISVLDSVKPIQKKLDELEAEVRDKRRHGGNPFGKIGAIAGGNEASPTKEDEDQDILKKLEEFEMKMDKLGNRISTIHETEKTGGGFVHTLEGILPGKLRLKVENFASRFSHGDSGTAQTSSFDDARTESIIKPSAVSAVAAGGITFAPVEEKVSEEELESLIFDAADTSAGKLKIKFHEPSDFSDASKIQEDLRAGDVILVNVKPLRQNDMELLRKIVGQLKKTCASIDGSIAGVGDNYLIVMPKNVQLHRAERTSG